MPDLLPEPDGSLRLRLDAQEAHLLRGLVGEMQEVLGGEHAPGDAVMGRLFPRAYKDDRDEASFREMVGGDLEDHKRMVFASMSEALGRRGDIDVVLDGEQAGMWLAALTDLRLAIGIRLGVDEEMMEREPDPGDPQGAALAVLHWLGFVQDTMVRHLMGPDE